ncbi:MAG TPA: ABC transporter ATP-binding protein [Lacipirellulaceae bacterium]|jgi:ABC-2 type transport system ATP-binding protein|nr:ABC transporter ATP-binding protein [Lacipirellulaceae bacterium]
MNDDVLRTDRLRKDFGSKEVLRGIDFAIEPGTVLGLLGANGSGKTTLIKCALGLVRPTAGEVTVFGEGAWDLSAAAKARLGYVPQEVSSYPWMRVRQVIAYTAAFYPRWDQPFVDSLCNRWHVPLEDRVGALSTGQLQTVGIVLALGHRPDFLILDEPVASLDPSARRQFLRTLLELLEDSKQTILFSTHITSDLERVAERVAILGEGKIRFNGELDDLKDRVKRLRITARHDLPASFAVPGALRCEVAGAHATVSVSDFDERLVAEVRQTWDADVAVNDLNLEEIFVEMHDGAAI